MGRNSSLRKIGKVNVSGQLYEKPIRLTAKIILKKKIRLLTSKTVSLLDKTC